MKFLHFLGVLFVVLCTTDFSMQDDELREAQCQSFCRYKKLLYDGFSTDNFMKLEDRIYFSCYCRDKSIENKHHRLLGFAINNRQGKKLKPKT